MSKAAVIVGTGSGISASLARALGREGYRLGLVSRNPEKFSALAASQGAVSYAVDASSPVEVASLFESVERDLGPLDLVVYNASYRVRGPFVDIDPGEMAKTLAVTAYGGFLVGQQAARRMQERGEGAIFFTGASASVKGYAQSAPFAMGKFALRGLAQAMARELQPKGIHVAHFVIDGGVRSAARGRVDGNEAPDSLLDPDGIADTYLSVLKQPRSAWSLEVELRPWVERF